VSWTQIAGSRDQAVEVRPQRAKSGVAVRTGAKRTRPGQPSPTAAARTVGQDDVVLTGCEPRYCSGQPAQGPSGRDLDQPDHERRALLGDAGAGAGGTQRPTLPRKQHNPG